MFAALHNQSPLITMVVTTIEGTSMYRDVILSIVIPSTRQKKKTHTQAKCCHDPVLKWVLRPFRIILLKDIETMNVTHPLGMLIFTHSLFLYPKPFLFSTVACNATPARSRVTYGILKLQYFTPFLRNLSLDRLWFYCAHSYDFCSCINSTHA